MKPVPPDEAVATARRLIDRRRLQERTGIMGESAAIQEVLVKIEQMAPVSSTVLIQGESGTGKELVAKALHDLSPRRNEAVHHGQLRRAAGDAAGVASCSATRRAPSPAPPSGGWAGSSWPTAGPSSSTRSARSRCPPR